jgi:HSP20 family molecular chaperone IbpA
MAKEKRSFFEKLTGAVRMDEDTQEEVIIEKTAKHGDAKRTLKAEGREHGDAVWADEESEKDAELTVDVYHTPEMIVVKSMIAGVRPEDLDVSITRDSVTIRGKREEERVSESDDYLLKELYWGSFSRTPLQAQGQDGLSSAARMGPSLPIAKPRLCGALFWYKKGRPTSRSSKGGSAERHPYLVERMGMCAGSGGITAAVSSRICLSTSLAMIGWISPVAFHTVATLRQNPSGADACVQKAWRMPDHVSRSLVVPRSTLCGGLKHGSSRTLR